MTQSPLQPYHATVECYKVDIYVRGIMFIIAFFHEIFLVNQFDTSQVASMTVMETHIEPAASDTILVTGYAVCIYDTCK